MEKKKYKFGGRFLTGTVFCHWWLRVCGLANTHHNMVIFVENKTPDF